MARPALHERIASARAQREAQGRVRVRRTVARRDGARALVLDAGGEGRWLANFSGNDYLGLAAQFAVAGALQDAAAQHGAGATASHLVCGHHALHDALEQELADWLGAPRALLFGSGYLANLAVVQALLGDDDLCVQDRLNHASLIDAARLAGCRLRRYPHNDAEGALRQLRGAPEAAALLATDGVFSMDGDVAPLRDLALVARVQGATLYVD
ncbi:MAG: aminotransferase class I/II-fold pyridoxal phosphate-dependent enzyme, partial [Lysobacteraceae bacterium]